MTLHFNSPDNDKIHLKPIITVFGVGGAGGNAINNMITSKLEGVRFIAANTDAQALAESLAEKKIQLGHKLTQGLGAGSKSEIGAEAAEESIAEIERHITDSHMVFITAGMGGGTGTGAASIIAKAAKDKGILTIGVITKPFHFEGKHRMKVAEAGVIELRKHVDTLITIPNQNLFKISDEKTTFSNAFKLADKVLYSGIQGITDLIVMPGLINLDFADIKVVMSEMGHAVLGTGEAEGENRALRAAEAAIYNPLLAYSSISGAKGVLINITGGDDITLFEVDEAVNRVRQEVNNEETNVIFGSTFNENLTGKIRVSIVATGVDSKPLRSNLILQNKKTDETAPKDLMNKKIDPLPQTIEKDPENINWLKKFMNKIASDLEMKKILPTKTNEPAPVASPSKASLDENIYKVPAFIRRKSKEINE